MYVVKVGSPKTRVSLSRVSCETGPLYKRPVLFLAVVWPIGVLLKPVEVLREHQVPPANTRYSTGTCSLR